MQELSPIITAVTIHFKERRKNYRTRDIIERGVSAGQFSLISGLEYLQSRGIDADTINRVLLDMLEDRGHQPFGRESGDH